MANNVIALPVHRKPGRRRTQPVPNVPMAGILEFPAGRPTPDDRLADCEACIQEIAHNLLIAIRAVTALHRKYHPNS